MGRQWHLILSVMIVCMLPGTLFAALLHQWSFDEGTGTNAVDSAGGADGILDGATWTADRFGQTGKAVQTGHDMYVDPPDTVKTGVGTFAAWIYLDEYGGYDSTAAPIFSGERGQGATDFSYRLQVDDGGTLIFEAIAPKGNSSARLAESASALTLQTWTHVAGTYDGYTSRVFIDGTLADTGTTHSTYQEMYTGTDSKVGIGHLDGWGVQWFQGRIDDARVYDEALSADSIQTIMIPEPATLLSVVLGLSLTIYRRRKRT